MEFKPLPTKTRVSFDIPALLNEIKEKGVFYAAAKFEDLLTVRNYMARHEMPYSLKQTRMEGGFKLELRAHNGA